MQIRKLQNSKPSFGTYLGLNMQEKILLAKQRDILSSEQLNNLAKIENDGLNVVLEITNKYFLRKNKDNKGLLNLEKFVTLSNGRKSVDISDMKDIIEVHAKNKNSFYMHKFVKLFNNDFDLFGKIEKASKLLTEA